MNSSALLSCMLAIGTELISISVGSNFDPFGSKQHSSSHTVVGQCHCLTLKHGAHRRAHRSFDRPLSVGVRRILQGAEGASEAGAARADPPAEAQQAVSGDDVQEDQQPTETG